MAALMLALAAVLVVRRVRDSSVRLPWLLLALQLYVALWFLTVASTSASEYNAPDSTMWDYVQYYVDPFFFWLATTMTLAYAVWMVCDAHLGGVRSPGGLVLASAAGVVCIIEVALTMAEGNLLQSKNDNYPQSFYAAYIYSSCGGGCPDYSGTSSWYRTLAPLALPCTNPWVSPVVALVAVLRGALLVGVAVVWWRAYRYGCTSGGHAAGVEPVPSDGDPMAYTLMTGAPAPAVTAAPPSRATKVYTWLTRVVIVLAFLQQALLVGVQGPAAGTACSCVDTSPCTDQDFTLLSSVLHIVGRGAVALVPTLAIATMETWRYWRGDTTALARLAVALN